MVAGATFKYNSKLKKFVQVGPKLTRCSCGEGWTLCDYCFTRK